LASTKSRRNQEREDRIAMEIVVDAYDEQERAIGWYCYLQEHLQFPFKASCTAHRDVSPLQVKEQVQVVGMPNEDECQHEILVTIPWGEFQLAVPLAQLSPAKGVDKMTKQAVADWHYWVNTGYQY